MPTDWDPRIQLRQINTRQPKDRPIRHRQSRHPVVLLSSRSTRLSVPYAEGEKYRVLTAAADEQKRQTELQTSTVRSNLGSPMADRSSSSTCACTCACNCRPTSCTNQWLKADHFLLRQPTKKYIANVCNLTIMDDDSNCGRDTVSLIWRKDWVACRTVEMVVKHTP